MSPRRNLVRFATLLLLPVLLAACAVSGQSLPELQSSLKPVPPGFGRIFIYRTTAAGMAVQPSIKVNEDPVGSAVPHGFFYVDRPAGDYRISSTTEVTRTLSVALAPGQTRYVRMGISFGFFVGHVYPELVDDSEALNDLASCHYVGDPKA
jgi:Protein of unknown function (DUF2846)